MKALVVYGTRWGGTVRVAQKVGEVLQEEGCAVDVVDARGNVPDAGGYDLVVVGSGVRADKWTKETLRFLEDNADTLRGKKTALFVSCQMADREGEAREKAERAYLWSVAERYGLQPISCGFFGGFLDFSKSHGLLVDIIVRVNRRNLRRNGLDTSKIYDTRDWRSIAAWGREVAEKAAETCAGEP
jgi:menaquinone-dependent protoporphyrinogen IX oxidase